jgi:hypothetical protein
MSKSVAVLVACLAAVVLPALLVLALVVCFHKDMIDSIYKNVEDISDSELPPTVASFQSGPEVVSTIGGSGEGLNCSLPALTNFFFDHSEDKNGKRHLVLQRFRQACVFHDLCYRHGLATYGYNQRSHSTERGFSTVPLYPDQRRSGGSGPLPDRFKNGSSGREPRRR